MTEFFFVLVGFVASLLISGFYSGMETASYTSSSLRLEVLAHRGSRRAIRLRSLLADMPGLVILTLIGSNMANYSATFLIERYFSFHLNISNSELWATLLITPLCFIFGESLPKQIGFVMADVYCLASVRIIMVSRLLFRPFVLLLGGVGWILRLAIQFFGFGPLKNSLREEVLASIEIHTAEGLLNGTQQHLVHHILEVEQFKIRSFLHPLSELPLLKKGLQGTRVLTAMRESGTSVVLVMDESRLQVEGVIRLDDLVSLPDLDKVTAGEIMQPVILLPSSTSIARSCIRLQCAAMPVGVVIQGKAILGLVYFSTLLSAMLGQGEFQRPDLTSTAADV